jgi:phage-related protein
MESFDIEFYKTTNDECPVQEFLDSLNHKMRVKILRIILLLEEHGNELREPYSKSLGDEIFELRIKQGSNITRILYFFMIGKKIILTNGFIKKTQKTPQNEIDKAQKYRDDYMKRKEL